MKIIHCVNSFSSLSGGVGFSIKTLIENTNGFSHTILTLYDNEPLIEISDDVKIFRFKRNGPFAISYSYSLENFLFKLANSNPNCTIHVHGLWSGLSFSALRVSNSFRNINLIISPHGMLSSFALQRKKFFKIFYGFFIEKPLLRRANCIHVLNNNEENSLLCFINTKKYKIIPHPQVFEFGLNEINKIWDCKINKKKLLLYIGRLHETKGVFEMLTALNDLVSLGTSLDFRIDIYGFGDKNYIDNVIKYIEKNNLNAQFKGLILKEDKKQAFLDAHAIILPSQTEGLPMSLIEASSFGLPLFITNECNLDWVINKSHGYKFKFSTDNIKKLLINFNNDSSENLKKMGLNTFEKSMKIYNGSKVYKLWKTIY
jgi:glycosyltransferase involved in cell wall biosynthesis